MANGSTPSDPKYNAPPTLIVNRKVTVQLGVLNTIRYPGDLFENQDSTWHEPGTATSEGPREPEQPHPITHNNQVRFFVDGPLSLTAMEEAIAAAGQKPGDFIYLLNWFADPGLIMPKSGKRFGDMLGEANDRNVQIRGLFWKEFYDPTFSAFTWLETMVGMVFPPWQDIDGRWKTPHGHQSQNEAMVDFINTGKA